MMDNGGVKIFVGGLSHDTTDSSLLKYFEKFGKVVTAVVLRDPETLSSRGFGFVSFSNRREAENVVQTEEHFIDNKLVETKYALPRTNTSSSQSHSHQGQSSGQPAQTHSSSNSNSVAQHQISSSTKSPLHQPSMTSQPNGPVRRRYADVGKSSSTTNDFQAVDSSSGNVSHINIVSDVSIQNRDADVEPDGSYDVEDNDYIETKVFVGGLMYSTVSDTLKEYFKKFGDVSATEIIYNKESKISRGFGFVEFKEPEAVEDVLHFQEYNQRHRVDGKAIEVKKCKKKNDPNYLQYVSNNDSYAVSPAKGTTPIKNEAPVEAKKVPIVVPPILTEKDVKTTSFAQAAALGTRHEKAKEVNDSFLKSESMAKAFDFDDVKYDPIPRKQSSTSSAGASDFLSSLKDTAESSRPLEESNKVIEDVFRNLELDKPILSEVKENSPSSDTTFDEGLLITGLNDVTEEFSLTAPTGALSNSAIDRIWSNMGSVLEKDSRSNAAKKGSMFDAFKPLNESKISRYPAPSHGSLNASAPVYHQILKNPKAKSLTPSAPPQISQIRTVTPPQSISPYPAPPMAPPFGYMASYPPPGYVAVPAGYYYHGTGMYQSNGNFNSSGYEQSYAPPAPYLNAPGMYMANSGVYGYHHQSASSTVPHAYQADPSKQSENLGPQINPSQMFYGQ